MKIELGQRIIDKIRGKKRKPQTQQAPVQQMILNKILYCYDNEWRTRIYEEMKAFDIEKEYKELINGLDDESIKIVSRIIHRIFNINEPLFLYGDEEKKQSIYFDNAYNITKLTEDCWVNGKYFLPVNCFDGNVFIDRMFISEFKHPERFADKDILDVGAYVGDSSLILSEYTSKNIYAFEPVQKFIDLIKQTIKLNNKQNIIPVQKGLDESNKTIYASELEGATSYILNNGSEKKVELNLTTLDDFVKENNIKVGLIKVDIEGAEQNFIKGAINTIKTQKPSMVISCYHTASDFFNLKKMIESIGGGYTFKIRNTTGHILIDTCLICEAE